MQPRKEALQQGQNPESQINLPKETYQMTLSLSKHFRKPDNSSKHEYRSSPCCLEHTAYQYALKLVTQLLLHLKL